MLEINVPRDAAERILIEREVFGKQAMNVIACEGPERIERPDIQAVAGEESEGRVYATLNQEIAKVAKDILSLSFANLCHVR